MTKIKELLNDKNSVLAFDMDGVLAVMEWGERNHFNWVDEEFKDACKDQIIEFDEDKVSKTMLKFIQGKDTNKMHVITKVYSEREAEFKKKFANRYYNIPEENFYCVSENRDKVDALNIIKNKYKNINDENIIMIDDSTEVLNEIMKKTNYSTAHISSFLDW